MLRLCLPLRHVSIEQKLNPLPIDLSSKHLPGRLFLADRAVKSTAAHPCFVCLDNAMACQTVDSNAALAVRSCAAKGVGVVQYGQLRFQGSSAALVFRHNHLVFQGFGDTSLQTFESSLQHNDIFALVSGIDLRDNLAEWVREVEKAVMEGDVEYVAEEMLLRLRGATKGCTSAVARISKFSSGLPVPPTFSHAA